jgi:hypothetical protein
VAKRTAVGYGEEVARLNLSLRLLTELTTMVTSKSVDAVKEEPRRMVGIVESLLREAIKDNNTIYMDRVPLESGLSPVEGVVMVRAADPFIGGIGT